MEQVAVGLTMRRDARTAWLIIDRPERRNAMDTNVMIGLVEVLERLATEDDVRVVVLRGSGDVAFSSGADMKQDSEGGNPAVRTGRPMGGLHRNVFEALYEFSKPTIAAINGFALGGGLELALACDIRIAADHAILGTPEAKRGLGANFATQMLPRVISRGLAFEMLYTGRDVDAEEAYRIGLVNMVCPLSVLDATVAEMAGAIAANAPLSVRRYKAMIVQGQDLPLAAALRLGAVPDPYGSADRVEGAAAFRERRAPNWQGR